MYLLSKLLSEQLLVLKSGNSEMVNQFCALKDYPLYLSLIIVAGIKVF